MNKVIIMLVGALVLLSGCTKSQKGMENNEIHFQTKSGHDVIRWHVVYKGYAIHDPECRKCKEYE